MTHTIDTQENAADINEQSAEYKMAILAEKDISEKVTKAIKSNKVHRRWFWELLQNAKDTIVDEPDRKVSVRLTYDLLDNPEPVISFEHDGNPFKYAKDRTRFDDLTNLILPLSGKTPGNTVGKFGTGFLSTHILSMKIRVQGVYENETGQYSDFDLIINRSESDRRRLIESIVKSLNEQKKSFIPIQDGSYHPEKNQFRTTKFTYYLSDNKNGVEYANTIIDEGLDDIVMTLPFVLNFVDEIDKVELVIKKKERNEKVIFCKTSKVQNGRLHICTVTKSRFNLGDIKESPDEFTYIASIESDSIELATEVIPELNSFKIIDFKAKYSKHTRKEFPTLFSAFPLIGSEDFKFPMVINSMKFSPNETRDGVELKSNIDGNQALIDKAVSLYSECLDIISKGWKNTYVLALTGGAISPNHDWINKKWFEEGNSEYKGVLKPIRSKILKTPLVDILNNRGEIERKAIKSPDGINQVYFPLREKMEMLYNFGSKVFPQFLPLQEDIENWASVVWSDKEFVRVNIEWIVRGVGAKSNIQDLASLLFNDGLKIDEAINWLHQFYSFIKTDYNEKSSLLFNFSVELTHCKIVLNRDLSFSLLSSLKRDGGCKGVGVIDDTLLTILQELTGENLKIVLLHDRFSELLPTIETLYEENVAIKIRDTLEGRLRKDYDYSIELRNSISKLYDWISIKANDDKEYFREALKNRMLSAIMPLEKIKFVTKILELDRNKTISLERQVNYLSDPNFDRIFQLGTKAFEAEQLNEADFGFKKAIGVHIENLIRKKVQTEVRKFVVTVREKQGGQDMVILVDDLEIYFIEVKSRWNISSSITMSNTQIKKATRNKSIYALCSVDMSDYKPDDGNRYEVPDISLILNRIRFLDSIGEKIEPLISNAMSVEAKDDEVKLTDEYRAIIPQALIKRDGIEFDAFVNKLIETLNLK